MAISGQRGRDHNRRREQREQAEVNGAPASLVHLGPYTMMKNGLEYVNTSIGGVLDAPIAVGRELDNTLATNLSQYRARAEKQTGNPRTKFEVEATLQQQSSINKTQISRYVDDKLTVVVLANLAEADPGKIAEHVAELYLAASGH